ncbi:MAG: DUF4835 family protein [Cytophagales bacterium]|nr:MAG: DUF4835 family protein [Cytophagales bacterium]TAF60835.1 MAG: DUF4835 family protein [Cytophagales bacterium]
MKPLPETKKSTIFLCLSTFIFLCFVGSYSTAQELNCNVIVNGERVQTQEQQVFEQLKQAIAQFMNTTKWTDERFEDVEKIQVNIALTLNGSNRKENQVTNVSEGLYTSLMQVQFTRPIYGTNYTSPVFSFIDQNFNFRYKPNEPLIFIENTTNSNLTAMLAYYAYMILGMDYDSFGRMGGTNFYEKGLNIVNNALGASALNNLEMSGWRNDDIRNRYWLAENFMNPQLNPVREAFYAYHRSGLDKFEKSPEQARRIVLDAFLKIKKVKEIKPNALIITAFMAAKADELYQLFLKSDLEMRTEAADMLSNIDPMNSGKYRKLLR